MAGSLIGALRVMLGMDSAEFEKGATSAERRAARMEKNFAQLGGRMTDLGKTLSVAVTAPLVGLGVTAVQAAMESQDAIGQVEAALKSMGGAAGRSSEQLQALASSQMSRSLYDDDEILRSVTANLLTFGQVAGDNFDRASQAAIDLAARLNMDLQSATLMVGKALNDPVKGLTALSRSGIQFTEQQKEQIKAMAAVGDTAGAQAIMLKELENQFGGAAQAARDADPFAAMKQSFAEFQENVGGELLKAMPAITGAITSMLGAFNSLGPGMQQVVVIGGVLAAVLGPVLIGLGSIVSVAGPAVTGLIALKKAFDFAGVIKNIVPLIGVLGKAMLGLLANPIVLGAAVVIGGIWLAWKNWDKIAPIIEGVGAAISSWYEGTVKPVFDKVMAAIEPFVTFFKDYFGAQITGTLNIVSALLKGDFSAAWEAARTMATRMFTALANLAASVMPGLVAAGREIVAGLVAGIKAAPGAVWEALKSVVGFGVDKVKAFLGIRSPSKLFMQFGGYMVDGMAVGINANMGKLTTALTGIRMTVDDFASQLRSILDRAFPQEAALRDLNSELAVLKAALDGNVLSAEQAYKAMNRLGREYADQFYGKLEPVSSLPEMPELDPGFLKKFNDKALVELDKFGNKAEVTTVRVAESFKDMAQGTSEALRNLVGAIKGGGFFDILDGVIGLVTQLGSIGLFGSGFANAMNGSGTKVPGFAGGVRNFGGGWAVTGERGPELLKLPRGTDVYSNADSKRMLGGDGGQALRVTVTMDESTGALGAFVQDQAGQVVAQAAPALIRAGGQAGVAQMARMRDRALA